MSDETLAEREAREWREWINGPSPSLHNVPWQKIPTTIAEPEAERAATEVSAVIPRGGPVDSRAASTDEREPSAHDVGQGQSSGPRDRSSTTGIGEPVEEP